MAIGIVGLGRMGLALSRALIDTGAEVHGYDRNAGANDAAQQAGVAVHASVAELAAAADVIVTSLPTAEAVREAAVALADALASGSLLIETSTCGPALARELGRLFEARELRFVDGPVSRKAPEMTMLIGGKEGVLGSAAETLGAVARDIVYCGQLGAGYSVKLLQQYLKYSRFLAASEALTFARRAGLDVAAVIRGLESGTGAEAGLATAEEFFEADRAAIERHAPTTTIVKDVELADRMFAEAGFASPTFAALHEFFLAAGADGLGERPYPEAARLLDAYRFIEETDA